MGVVDMNGEI